jgi:superoxide dismutase, Cu-Zn family
MAGFRAPKGETRVKRAAIGFAAGALLLVGTTSAFAQSPTQGGTAALQTPDGQNVGTATFTQESGGVRLRVQATGLPPGPHGIHVHAVGRCDPPDFMSAGGHFNPTNRQHGLNNPQGAHAGDMPSMTIGPDGSGAFDHLLADVTTAAGTGSLFGPDGTALVIHADPDDQMTDPAGNSGGRIACGVIRPAAASAVAAPAAQPSPAAKPVTTTAPAAQPSPAALPRTGVAPVAIDLAVPAAVAGVGALLAGLALWRRRR